MINESDFLALIEAAGDLDDLRNNRYFVFRRPSQNRQFARCLRAWAANGDAPGAREGWKALEKWTNSEMTGGLGLRNSTKLPGWAEELRRMLVHFPHSKPCRQGSLSHRVVEPAIAYGSAELQRRLGHEGFYPFPASVLQCFEKQLEDALIRTVKLCLDLQLKAFEAAVRCVFPTRGEIRRAEIERKFIGEHPGDQLIRLFQSFPALAKLWSQVIGNWLDKISELASRLNADRGALRQMFFGGRNPGDLVDITLDISDPHRGGRETMILRFRKGHVVYKPRSGGSEGDWFSFVRWVNRQGFAPSLRILRFLQRRDYYWAEFVEHLPCATKSDAPRYYRRAGGLLCAAYLLGAIDCHRDNVIASRAQPMLIDTETLFHPKADLTSTEEDGSVTRTGLLPIPRSLSRSRTDISAFGGTAGKHTPTFKGRLLVPPTYSTDVLRGFCDMWSIIGEPRAQTRAVFRRRLRRLGGRPWRRIYRSTRTYFEIRARSLAPDALRSGLGRSQRIAVDLLQHDASASILLEEISAIGRFDVPYFLEAPCESPPGASSLSLSDLLARVRSALLPRN